MIKFESRADKSDDSSLKSLSVILRAGGSDTKSANLSATQFIFLLRPFIRAPDYAKLFFQSLVFVSMIWPLVYGRTLTPNSYKPFTAPSNPILAGK